MCCLEKSIFSKVQEIHFSLLFCAKAQTRLSIRRSDGIKFDICDICSVIVVIGSLLIIN